MSKIFDKGTIHIVIGDTQVKPGVPTNNLTWIGNYIVDQFAGKVPAARVKIIHLGDHADMPSLSSYDKGKKQMEGRRYKADILAANKGFYRLNKALIKWNERRPPSKQWWPKRYILEGNHEFRIVRACESDPQLDGVISINDLNYKSFGWKVVPFLKPLYLDGIAYCHYFYNQFTGKPFGGANLHTRLQTIGRSFTMGHQQGLKMASRDIGNRRHMGLVLGSSYLHDEGYMGPQGHHYWRGMIVCHQVERGSYDAMQVSLDYLCRRYEKQSLRSFLKSKAHSAS